MTGSLGLLLLLVTVVGDTSCPTPAEVSAELTRLPPGPGGAAALRAELSDLGGRVALSLRDADGRVVGHRELARAPACSDVARAVATVIAVWQREYAADVQLPLRLRQGLRPPSSPTLELGLQFRAVVNAVGFAPGGALEAQLHFAPGGAGVRLAVAYVAPVREGPLAEGQVEWSRVIVAPGFVWRFGRGRVVVDLQADALLGATSIAGIGYQNARQAWAFDPGVAGGARLGVRLGGWLLHAGAAVQGWPRQQRALVNGGPTTLTLPQVDGLFSVGAAAVIR